jgi:L-alanine-DL-glutamate epimerase-like enolase superfamily enzyme
MQSIATIDGVRAQAFTVPTDKPEADGTFEWTATTLVLAEVDGGGMRGLGYTYTHPCIVSLIEETLKPVIAGRDGLDPPGAWAAMQRTVRNLGRDGLAATAISAVDAALWDLKAKLLDLPLASLLGRCRDAAPIYGSGGFTSYSDDELAEQLSRWAHEDGCRWVKMKIGAQPERDPHRVAVAKQAIGGALLLVDANGAYQVKQALALAERFVEQDVRWFEEPVSSDDLEGLRRVRENLPAKIELAAGEYAYTVDYVRRMLESGAVDVQQADASRCGGVTGFLQIAGLCDAHHIDLSSHCAPSLHLHAACAAPRFRHQEWFHDHVRIEQMLFDGAPVAHHGAIEPDLGRPGQGLVFKRQDAERFRVNGTAR